MDILDRIKKEIDSETLIGCFHKAVDGSGYFSEIRGNEGEISKDYSFANIPYNADLIEDEFYEFQWKVINDHSPLLVSVIGEPTIIDKAEFLHRLYAAKASLRGSNKEYFINSQENLFKEVTGADHTYIYELLQNANDYPSEIDNNIVRVKFVVTPHYLLFLHTGREFNLKNITAICTVNQGEKRGNTKTIGYKGIGFKTVFVNNDYVYLRSGDWRMRFDEQYVEEHEGKRPWVFMPISTPDTELDSELSDALAGLPKDYRVAFALRNKRGDASENMPQLDKVFSDSQILLFIPNVYEVEVDANGECKYSVTKDKDKWLVESYEWPIAPELRDLVEEDIKKGGKIPEKFREIDSINISFAAAKDGNKIVPIDDARVYNYLPTELRLNFGFLINADFVPNGARNGFHDTKWNAEVMLQCGKQFVTWLTNLLSKEGEWDANAVLSLIPRFDTSEFYAKQFQVGFVRAIKEAAFIPTKKNGKYKLAKMSEVIWDELALTYGDNQMFTDDEFYKFTETSKLLPIQELRNNQVLRSLLKDLYKDSDAIYGGTKLGSLPFNKHFLIWLTKKENNIKFNSFLLREDWMMNLTSRNILLSSKGTLQSFEKLYADVDDYVQDLPILDKCLERIDTEVRDELCKVEHWNNYISKFKQLNQYQFANEVLEIYKGYPDSFVQEDNSVGYIRVIAALGVRASSYLPAEFTFVTTDGKVVKKSEDLYIRSEFGQEFMSHPWVNPEWTTFISDKYFEKNSEPIKAFLLSAGISELNADLIYRKFLNNEERGTQIAERIKDRAVNIDFYRYLAIDLKLDASNNKFTSGMKARYSVVSTDGSTEHQTLLSTTVFFQSEGWEEAIHFKWMPASICMALSSCYVDGLSEDDQSRVRSFFGHDNLISPVTVGTLKTLIRTQKNLEAICSHINSVNTSKSFLKYLIDNQQVIFKEEKPSTAYRAIPILVDGATELCPLASLKSRCYYHNNDLDMLLTQSWMSEKNIPVCSSEYNDLFTTHEGRKFMAELGLYAFELIPYIQRHVLAVPDMFKNVINEREANVAFHKFFFGISQKLTGDDFEALKSFPIYIVSPDNPEGEIVNKSTDHYLPSDLLTDIISKDIVPIDILDCIHLDYVTSPEERSYYINSLGNRELDTANFLECILQEGCQKEIKEYITDQERNVRFWRWVCDSKFKQDDNKKFKVFPIFGHELNSVVDIVCKPEELFISSAYSDTSNIETFFAEFAVKPYFVSDAYKEANDGDRDWSKLFKALHITTDTGELIAKHVLPNLSQYQRVDIVDLLADQEKTLSKQLREQDNDEIKGQFAELLLLCADGNYRKPSAAILSGRYFDIENMPFPDINMANLVSEEYITRSDISSDKVSRICRLLCNVADVCGNTLSNHTQIRNEKLNYFLAHQDLFKEERHLNIIRELAQVYTEDPDGIKVLYRQSNKLIRLWGKDGKLHDSADLYFGSAYQPECDFEANGITYRPFISDDYIKGQANKDVMFKFFRFLNVCGRFREQDIQLLANERFSRYFWSTYATNKEFELANICTCEKLRDVACIPSANGNKKAMELYNYRNEQLQKMVLALSDGATKLPNVELPEWVKYIGLRTRLCLSDCLEYLKLDIPDYRRDVMKWVIETPDDVLRQRQHEINKFIESANWFNGQKKFVPLKELVALQWHNETLTGNFSSSSYVCNPAYMPEFQSDYNRLCSILKIQVITNNDFKKIKSGKYFDDEEAKTEIAKRLLYISYKSGRDEWKDIYMQRKAKLDACEICSCDLIEYKYDDNIKTDLPSYIEDDEHLWYQGSWLGPLFLDILTWVKRVFEIKGFDDALLKKMFLTPFSKFLQQQDYDYSPEFYVLLSQEDKAGLNIAEEDTTEEFVEDYEDDAQLDDSLNHESDNAAQNIESPQQPVNTPTSDDKGSGLPDPDEEDDGIYDLDGLNEEEEYDNESSTPATRKTRSDKGGHHQSYQRSAETQRPEEHHSNPSSSVEHPKEKKDVKSKLIEKWKQEAAKPVSRPAAHYSGDGSYQPQAESYQPPQHSSNDVFGNQEYDSRKSKSSFATSQSDLKARNTEAQRHAEEAEENLAISDLLDQTEPYTYLWFKYLTELVYSDCSKSQKRSQQVDFYQREFISDKKILRLYSPSSVVQAWVEGAGYTEVFAYDNRASRKVKGTLVKVDSVSIDIMLNDNVDDDDMKLYHRANFFRLNAESDTNFITSLTRRFLQLGYPDDYNLKDNLPDAIRFIYGPPGTGKTTRLVKEISDILKGADAKTNILVLTPTNKAADVIAKRLTEDEDCFDCLSRYGSTEDPALIEDCGIMTTRDTMDMDLYDNNIVVTTVARYAYDTLKPDDTVICEFPWDYIVIDEASMIDIVNITYILHKGKESQFIIAGDPKQIQPIDQNQINLENIYQMVGIDNIRSAIQDYKRYPIVPLLTQYRSVPVIGNLVSRFSYDGMVKPFAYRAPQKPLQLDGIPTKTLNFIGFDIQEFDSLTGIGAINESAFHLYAAIFTYNMARYMAEQIAAKYSGTDYTIGIVCPYGAEAKAISQLLERRPIDQANCKISCGTVHSFQGDECDIMLVVMNPPAKVSAGTHINNENIVNVAMSRARDYLFLVAPSSDGYQIPVMKHIGNITNDSDRQLLKSWELEKTIFGDDDYIRNHTSVTCHLPVNVYYDSAAEYEVRIDDHALDIQLNEMD